MQNLNKTKIFLFLGLCTFFTSSLQGNSPCHKSVEETMQSQTFLDKGKKAFDGKQFNDALVHFDNAISYKGDDPEVFFYRGRTWAALKDFSKAVKDFTQAILIRSNSSTPYFHRGIAKLALGDYTSAKLDFERAIASGIQGELVLYAYALAKFHLKEFRHALFTIGMVLAERPDYTTKYFQWITQATSFGPYSTFFKILKHPIMRDHLEMGIELLIQGKFEAAVRRFQRAERQRENSISLQLGLGLSYKALGKRQLALNRLDKAVAIHKSFNNRSKEEGIHLYTIRAMLRNDENLFKEALDDINRASRFSQQNSLIKN